MTGKQLVFDFILNISLLVMIANMLSKMKIVHSMLLQEQNDWKRQAVLSALFSLVIILSTYTSITINGCNFNTRVIGALASGLLGGPVVGMYASLIGAIHAYFYQYGSAFAMSSAFSTAIFGLLGGGFYPYFQRGKWKYRDLFVLACFAVLAELVVILRLASPFVLAFQTVLQIGLPMILFNSFGLLLFISSFNTIFIQQDIESSRQLKLVSDLSRTCLPLLGKGLHNQDNMWQMASILLHETDWSAVMIAGRSQVLEWQDKGVGISYDKESPLPEVVVSAMDEKMTVTMSQAPLEHPLHEVLKDYIMAAAPFVVNGQSVGALMVMVKKQWMLRRSEVELVQNIVTIGAAQLAAVELEQQKMMRQKAEFKALQFQVNPHFLFNALNTISCVCRENSERARELLVVLATYFRYNLKQEQYMLPLSEEIQHVKDYLKLEQARFESKLEVHFDVPEDLDMPVPTLILQPIVENAVRHGVHGMGCRYVSVRAVMEEEEAVVAVCDKGRGFPQEVLDALERNESPGRGVGLLNVHKRMKSIYGEEYGLTISSTPEGSCVELRFRR